MVSVIVTAYNVENYIEECVLSIINQSYGDIEIILVNDGSNDNTGEICEDIITEHTNIKYLYQKNCGVSVARNRGIEEAEGDFIMFVDGDDKLDRNMIKGLLDEADDCELDVICCCCCAFSDKACYKDYFFENSFVASECEGKDRLFGQLFNGNYGKGTKKSFTAIGVPWGKLYRRLFLLENNLRFNPQLRRMQDNVFNMYAFDVARKIKYVNKPYYFYRLDHITSGKVNMTPENYYSILDERVKFLKSRSQYATAELMRCLDYEVGVALTVSVEYIVSHNKLSQAKQQFEELVNKTIYKEFILEMTSHKSLTKHHLVIYALKYKLYLGLYLLFVLKCLIKKKL